MLVDVPLLGVFATGAFAVLAVIALPVRRNQTELENDAESLVQRVAALEPPADWSGKLDRSFDRLVANTLLPISPSEALGYCLLAGALPAAIALVAAEAWWVAVAAAVGGMGLALTGLLILRSRWQRRVQEDLPEGLFILAQSLRAGLSLEKSFQAAAVYSPPLLGSLFRRCAQQTDMGYAAGAALEGLADQVRLADFDSLVAIITLFGQTGGNLPALLDRLAADVRDRNLFRGYLRTATAVNRIGSIFLAVMGPTAATILAVLAWDFFAILLEGPAGWLILGTCVALELVGLFCVEWLWRRIEY